jgi:peptide/nickel transport system substrate-binding protein
VKRAAGLTLKASFPTFTEWVVFTEQWDQKSPWHDRRVRLAANLAIDRKAINDSEYLGFGKLAANIVPRDFEFCWAPRPIRTIRAGPGNSCRRRVIRTASTPPPASRPS